MGERSLLPMRPPVFSETPGSTQLKDRNWLGLSILATSCWETRDFSSLHLSPHDPDGSTYEGGHVLRLCLCEIPLPQSPMKMLEDRASLKHEVGPAAEPCTGRPKALMASSRCYLLHPHLVTGLGCMGCDLGCILLLCLTASSCRPLTPKGSTQN